MTVRPGIRPRRFGYLGAAFAVLGIIAAFVGMLGLDWADERAVGQSTVPDLADLIDLVPSSAVTGLAGVYFHWLCWVLLAAAGLLAVVANLPSAPPALRPIGAIVGLGAAAVTVFAIRLAADGPSLGDTVGDAGPGYWTTIAAFVAMAAGAAVGPRRR